MAAHLQSLGFAAGRRDRDPVEELRVVADERPRDLDGRRTSRCRCTRRWRPTRSRQILDAQRGASLLFVGKLDGWDGMKPGRAGGPAVHQLRRCRRRRDVRRRWDDDRRPHRAAAGRARCATPTSWRRIMYTSGTTGKPEGRDAQLRHLRVVDRGRPEARARSTRDARMLSYLPLAHVAERDAGRARPAARPACTSSSPRASTPSPPTCSARGRRCSSRCRGCGSSSSRACTRKMPPDKLRPPAAAADHRRHRAQARC